MAAVVVSPVVACSGGTVGTPVAELWDPCSIPSEAIAGAGVDPEVIDSGRFDQENSEWKFCSYRQDWYFFTVLSTSNSFDEVRKNPRATGIESVRVDTRDAITYQEVGEVSNTTCFAAFGVPSGSAVLRVHRAADANELGQTCGRVLELARAFGTHIPD